MSNKGLTPIAAQVRREFTWKGEEFLSIPLSARAIEQVIASSLSMAAFAAKVSIGAAAGTSDAAAESAAAAGAAAEEIGYPGIRPPTIPPAKPPPYEKPPLFPPLRLEGKEPMQTQARSWLLRVAGWNPKARR